MSPATPFGVESTATIDLLAQEPESGTLVLVMREPRPWDGSNRRLFELQEKFNTYVSYVLDGELAAQHPELAGAPRRIQLECGDYPDPRTLQFLETIRADLVEHGIDLQVRVKQRVASGLASTVPSSKQGSCGSPTCGCR